MDIRIVELLLIVSMSSLLISVPFFSPFSNVPEQAPTVQGSGSGEASSASESLTGTVARESGRGVSTDVQAPTVDLWEGSLPSTFDEVQVLINGEIVEIGPLRLTESEKVVQLVLNPDGSVSIKVFDLGEVPLSAAPSEDPLQVAD